MCYPSIVNSPLNIVAGRQAGTLIFRHLAIDILIPNLHILIKFQNSCQVHTKFSRGFLFSVYILFRKFPPIFINDLSKFQQTKIQNQNFWSTAHSHLFYIDFTIHLLMSYFFYRYYYVIINYLIALSSNSMSEHVKTF